MSLLAGYTVALGMTIKCPQSSLDRGDELVNGFENEPEEGELIAINTMSVDSVYCTNGEWYIIYYDADQNIFDAIIKIDGITARYISYCIYKNKDGRLNVPYLK